MSISFETVFFTPLGVFTWPAGFNFELGLRGLGADFEGLADLAFVKAFALGAALVFVIAYVFVSAGFEIDLGVGSAIGAEVFQV